MPRTRRFRPPLKASPVESQQQQPHTLLSYCDELQDEAEREESSRELEEDSLDGLLVEDENHFAGRLPPNGSMERTESSVPAVEASRQRNFRSAKPRAFHFSVLPKTLEKQRSILKAKHSIGLKQSARRTNTTHATKRVAITTPRGAHAMNPPPLAVFDYQPTPQPESDATANEQGLEGARCEPSRSREEQLAIDREVLLTIRQIRQDIKAIRARHAERLARWKQAGKGLALSPAGLARRAEE